MLTIADVTQDPTAASRSRLRPELFAEVRALGFDPIAWVSAIPTELPDEPTDADVLLTAVLVHRDGGALADLTQHGALEDVAFKTMLENGTIVNTGRKPKTWWKYRAGLTGTPARHAYDLAYVDARSVAELARIHESRVRRYEEAGQRRVERHDLRTYFAIRKRWREIADPRMRLQQSLAGKMAVVAALVTAVATTLGARAHFGATLGARPALVFLLLLATSALAIATGIAAFLGSLYFVAPILARRADAPPPRRARDLLALADSVPRGWLPAPGRTPSRRPASRADEATTLVRVSPVELARLQRVDLALAIANATALPVAALVATSIFGVAGVAVAFGSVFTTDGLLALVAKKTRLELLRARFVPALTRAEAEGASADKVCATGACATPFGKKVLGFMWLLAGLASLHAARIGLAARAEPAPAWLVGEWLAIAAVTAFVAFTAVKKRHKRLVSA